METRFNIDHARLAELLPFGMRSASVLGMIRAGFAPYSERMAEIFRSTRADDHFRLRHNGQVCYLRAALNAKFKSSLKGLYFRIADIGIERQWIYAKQENNNGVATGYIYARTEPTPTIKQVKTPAGNIREVLVYPAFNPPYAPSEVQPGELYSFIIYVPSDLYYSCLPQIKRLVEQYRLVTRIPQYEPINS